MTMKRRWNKRVRCGWTSNLEIFMVQNNGTIYMGKTRHHKYQNCIVVGIYKHFQELCYRHTALHGDTEACHIQ